MDYINFEKRNWGYKGDKGTWAATKIDEEGNKILIINKAKNGITSSGYLEEISFFAAKYGIDFNLMSCGERIEKQIL